jgi:hypothetical protein
LKRIRIAYAENRDYKQEVYKYMMSYRGNVHPATGKSPAELLFGRNIRMKIPTTIHCFDDVEARDCDSQYKGKSQVYTDSKRKAQHSEIQVGDLVLVKNENVGKAQPQFAPQPVRVIDRVGPRVVIETANGKRFERNVAVMKRYCPLISVPDIADEDAEMEPEPPPCEPVVTADQTVITGQPTASLDPPAIVNTGHDDSVVSEPPTMRPITPIISERPKRQHKPPKRFEDYEMN